MNNKAASAARRGRSWGGRIVAFAASLTAAVALAAEPMQLIVPFGPGSGADQLARHCAPAFESALTAPVQVTNLPGSTGTKAIAKLLQAPPDGRTVAVLTADTFATLAYANAPFKANDLVPLGIMVRQSSAFFVPASSRFARWQDVEKEARARPRMLRVAITGLGSPDYITLQQLAAKNIQLTPVPLASPKERFDALVSGEADLMYEQAGDVREFLDSGRLRPILHFGPSHGAAAGGVPYASDLGYGTGVPQFRAFVVRAGTSPQAIAALTAAVERIAGSADFRSFLDKQFAAPDSFVPARGASGFMERELAQMKKIVDNLPMHSQYLFEALEPGELPSQF